MAAAVLLLACSATGAQPSEIERLLARLGSSSCEFYRNGTWHGAAEARAHLQKKYDYLARRGLVTGAEEFIAKGATGSSVSGQPYLVRCAGRAAQPSAAWLERELKALREGR